MNLTFSYIDLIVIAILFFTTYFGKKRGLILTAYNFFSFFLTFILTKILYSPFNLYLQTTEFAQKIYNSVYLKLNFSDTLNTQVYTSSQDALTAIGVPNFLVDFLSNNINFNAYESFNLNTYRDLASTAMTEIIIGIVAFISVFVFVIIAIKIVGLLLHIVKKLPVISTLDSFGGGVFGLLNGCIIIFIAFLLVSALFIFSMNESISNAFYNSFSYNSFINLDLLNRFMSAIIG